MCRASFGTLSSFQSVCRSIKLALASQNLHANVISQKHIIFENVDIDVNIKYYSNQNKTEFIIFHIEQDRKGKHKDFLLVDKVHFTDTVIDTRQRAQGHRTYEVGTLLRDNEF